MATKPRLHEFYELVEAMSIIAYVHPFVNSIMHDKLKIVIDPDDMPFLATLATDGERILINSAYFKSLTQEQRVAALVHEMFHDMYMHCVRFKNYEETGLDGKPVSLQGMNIAADFIINDMIRQFRIGELSPTWLWRADVSYNESLEDVYRRLVPPPMPRQGMKGQGSGGQSGEQNSPGQGSGSQEQQGGQSNDGGGQGQEQQGNNKVPSGWGIKDQKGDVQPISGTQFDHHMGNDEGPSELEWHTAIQSAMQVAKSIGRLPADMERMLKEMLTIKKDWKEEFADQVRARSGFDLRNMRRANKRRLYHDRLYIPTQHSYQIEQVCFIFDVSGSVSMRETELFKGVAYDIFSQCRVKELRCLCVNSTVMSDDMFDSIEAFMDWMPRGSGGTDMEAGFRYMEEDDYAPDLCVVLTDGHTGTSLQNQPSDFPVVWITTSAEDLKYGKIIKMDINEAQVQAA